MSKNPQQEQSVSVHKGIWDAGMVLVGAGKLSYYWETDIHTKPVPGNPGLKIPLDAHRPKDFRPYDEALIRLSDVQWTELYVDFDNEEMVQAAGGLEHLQAIAQKYGLKLKHTAQSPETSPLSKRYEFAVTIKHLSEPARNIHHWIMMVTTQILAVPAEFPPEVVSYAQKVHPIIEKLDPTHEAMVKHPEKRARMLNKTFDELRFVYMKLKEMLKGHEEALSHSSIA